MKFINNRQNGDSVIKAVSTVFSVIGMGIVPDGLGAFIPYNGNNLLTIGTVSGGPFQVGETVTGGTSAATGVVVAVNSGSLVITTGNGKAFTATETITGGTSSATAPVTLYIQRNRIYGINDTVVPTTDQFYATAGATIGVQTSVKLMDKIDILATSGSFTQANVGLWVNLDPANPDKALVTPQSSGMILVTDFISATEVKGVLSLI